MVAGVALSVSATACAADDAAQILKAMSDYVGSQKSISATFDSDIEVLTPDLQKIQLRVPGRCNWPGRTRCGFDEPAATLMSSWCTMERP